jgi:AraC-like DNA-binding protein
MERFSFGVLKYDQGADVQAFSRVTAELARKYYIGDTSFVDQTQNPHLDLAMVIASPYPMATVVSRSRYVFRRTWDHIRDNQENLITLRYVKRGTVSISQTGKTCELKPGEFSFTRSNLPVCLENLPDNGEAAEWMFIMLPLEVVHRHFPNGVPICTGIMTSAARGMIVPSLMSLLGEIGDSIDRETADSLVNALLKEMAVLIEQQGAQVDPRESIGEKRIKDIISYISLRLGNPELSLSMVAQGCQVSPRYLSHLLKEHHTTFSQLLWTGRLNASREWLLRLDGKHYGIGEIAYMTGYKSVAHFSRMFREKFGCSPREFRRVNAPCESALNDRPHELHAQLWSSAG